MTQGTLKREFDLPDSLLVVRERAIELAVINRRLAHDTTNSD